MSDGGGFFGFEPEEIDRALHEAGEGLRDALGRLGGWGAVFETLTGKARSGPPTAGEAGDGVWAIYTVGGDGDAHVEQVYPTEIEALRAHRHNTDPKRKVRFLPYGIAVSVLDDAEEAT